MRPRFRGVSVPVVVLAELPPRYTINFVPAVSVPAPPVVPVAAVATPSAVSYDYSVVSSANFVVPHVIVSSPVIVSSAPPNFSAVACIESKP